MQGTSHPHISLLILWQPGKAPAAGELLQPGSRSRAGLWEGSEAQPSSHCCQQPRDGEGGTPRALLERGEPCEGKQRPLRLLESCKLITR